MSIHTASRVSRVAGLGLGFRVRGLVGLGLELASQASRVRGVPIHITHRYRRG